MNVKENLFLFLKAKHSSQLDISRYEQIVLENKEALILNISDYTEEGFAKIRKQVKCIALQRRVSKSDIHLIGIGELGMIAIMLANAHGINYLSICPSLNYQFNRDLRRAYKAINQNITSSTLTNGKGFGKLIYTAYDPNYYAHNESLLKQIIKDEKVQVIYLEDFNYQLSFKLKNYDFLLFVYEEIRNYIDALKKGISISNYLFFPGDYQKLKNRKYQDEQTFIMQINGKARNVKYMLNECLNSKVLVVSLNGEVKSKYNTEVQCGYNNYKCFSKMEANVLHIRPNFSFSGGFSLFNNGETYPQILIENLIDSTRESFGIKRENVVVCGSSAGAYSALYYAKKLKLGHVICLAATFKPEPILKNLANSILGIKIDENTLKNVNEMLHPYTKVVNEYSNINGLIINSIHDECIGSSVSEKLKSDHPNIEFICYEEQKDLVPLIETKPIDPPQSMHTHFIMYYYEHYYDEILSQYLNKLKEKNNTEMEFNHEYF